MEEQNLSEDKKEIPQEETKEEGATAENNEAIKEFLGDDPVTEEKKPSEPQPPEEEPQPVEEKVKVEEKKEEIPLEEAIEDVKTKAREEYKEEVLKALGVSETTKKEAEDAGFKFAWEERGEDKPATWREQSEETNRLYEFNRAEAEKVETQKRAEESKVQEADTLAVNQEWDRQTEYLRESGIIPGVAPEIKAKQDAGKRLTTEDKKDPGLKAIAEIWDKMAEIATEREEKGLKPIGDMVHVYNRYILPNKKKPAGANAPVSGGKKSVSQGTDDEMSYNELHAAKDFSALMR